MDDEKRVRTPIEEFLAATFLGIIADGKYKLCFHISTRLKASSKKACAHLEGDLDEEQIELYDLAFVQAELLAARTLISQTEQSQKLVPVCQYFCANAIVTITQKLAVRPQTFGLAQSELPVLDKLQDFWHLKP